jgi:hypothetical protein
VPGPDGSFISGAPQDAAHSAIRMTPRNPFVFSCFRGDPTVTSS